MCNHRYASSGIWKNPGPHDAALLVRGSHHVSIEACFFGAGVAGYGIGATDGSRGLRVVGCHVEGAGQGGVFLYGNISNHSQPTGATISHNVVRSSGTILKFVSGIGLHCASWSLVSHNRVEDMPRFGISADQVLPICASMHNILEFNVLARTSTETTDTGAIEMSGVAQNSKQLEDIGWDVRA